MAIQLEELYDRHLERLLFDKKPVLLPLRVALLAKQSGDVRDLFEGSELFPYWERVYRTHTTAIEEAYANAPDALLLLADPQELLLFPVSVVGGIDTGGAPILVNYARSVPNLPPLPPPRQIRVAAPWRIDPELEAPKPVVRFDPRHTAATQALRRATFERWPDLTNRELAAAPAVIYWLPQARDGEDARLWIKAVRAYGAPEAVERGVGEVIAQHVPEIAERMMEGAVAVVALHLRGEDHVLMARPDPVSEEPPSVLVGIGPERTIEDLLLEARANHPTEGDLLYAVLLHPNDPHRSAKLELVRGRVPDAEVLRFLSDPSARPRHKHPVLFFEVRTPEGRRESFVTRIVIPIDPRPPAEEVLFPNPTA